MLQHLVELESASLQAALSCLGSPPAARPASRLPVWRQRPGREANCLARMGWIVSCDRELGGSAVCREMLPGTRPAGDVNAGWYPCSLLSVQTWGDRHPGSRFPPMFLKMLLLS